MTNRQVVLKRKIVSKVEVRFTIGKLFINIDRKLSLKDLSKLPVYYEVIRGACKVYVDIDMKVKDRKSLKVIRDAILREIISKLDGVEYNVFDSSGYDLVKKIYKVSFHVVFNDVYCESGLDVLEYVKKFDLPNIDVSVYKNSDKMQLMRVPYCVKEGDSRILELCDKVTLETIPFSQITKEQYAEFIITNIDDCKLIEREEEFLASDAEEEEDEEEEEVIPDDINQNIYIEEKINVEELVRLYPREKQQLEYEEWRNWIFALKNVSLEQNIDLRDLAHEFSSWNSKYDEKTTDSIYNSTTNGEKKFTIASIIYWIKEVNEEGFARFYRRGKNSRSDLETLLRSQFTDADIADYFVIKHENEFIYYNNQLFHFNGVYWEKSNLPLVYKYLDDIYFDLLELLNKKYGSKDDSKLYEQILKNMLVLRRTRALENAWGSIRNRIFIDDDIFDEQAYLLGFRNGTRDLNVDIFRDGRASDYISLVAPYDYREATEEEMEYAYDFLNKIFPIPSERDFALKMLSTCLDGKLLENFMFLIGNGRNGKDTLCTSIMKAVLGLDLYYEGPNYLLTDTLKTGANPEVANMHKKRMVVYSEPSRKKTLNCATIKQLSGNENMPVRNLYEKTNQTKVYATHICMQNRLLAMDSPDDAMANRTYVILFRAQFRKQEDLDMLPEGTQHAYLIDSYYKSAEFLERIRIPMLHILLNSYKIFREEGRILKNAPKSIRDASKQYLSDSDEFVAWFNETYEITNDEKDYIKMKDIYDRFKASDLWNNMNKSERRRMNKTKLEKDIRENPTLRCFHRERLVRGGVDVRNIVIKHKLREIILEDDDIIYDE